MVELQLNAGTLLFLPCCQDVDIWDNVGNMGVLIKDLIFDTCSRVVSIVGYMASLSVSLIRCLFRKLQFNALRIVLLTSRIPTLHIFIHSCTFNDIKSSAVQIFYLKCDSTFIRIENSTFENNENMDEYGGAAIFIGIKDAVFRPRPVHDIWLHNNIIIGNKVLQDAGAVTIHAMATYCWINLSLRDNFFIENVAGWKGGALSF